MDDQINFQHYLFSILEVIVRIVMNREQLHQELRKMLTELPM